MILNVGLGRILGLRTKDHQFSRGLSREVTTTLDAEITTFTKNLWAEKRRTKRIGVNTTVRLWRLRKPV